jgi:hypothetical protein
MSVADVRLGCERGTAVRLLAHRNGLLIDSRRRAVKRLEPARRIPVLRNLSPDPARASGLFTPSIFRCAGHYRVKDHVVSRVCKPRICVSRDLRKLVNSEFRGKFGRNFWFEVKCSSLYSIPCLRPTEQQPGNLLTLC